MVFILFLLAVAVNGVEIGDDIKFDLELVKHQPCAYSAGKSKWSRKLEFESGNGFSGPKLESLPGRPGCYAIGGHVNVLQEFAGNFSIYLEIRQTAAKKNVPEDCARQDEDGCGGVGSCLYCDACSTFGDRLGVQAQLQLNGKSISCQEGLHPGSYDDLKLVFCMPNMDDLLETQGLTKESLAQLLGSESGGHHRSLGLFITAYVFDTDVRRQMAAQKRVVSTYRDNKKTFFKDEPLPSDVYWSLPFNAVIKKQQAFVACHKIYGNIAISY